MIKFLWFIGSFAGMLLVCLAGWGLVTAQMGTRKAADADNANASLLNLEIPTSDVTDAKTGEPVLLMEALLSDGVVILLGGMGCSLDQVEVLEWWQGYKAATDAAQQEIIALYADPLLGVERSQYETLVLRRAREVHFPTPSRFLVL